MKSYRQIVLLVVMIVVLTGGLAFVTQFTRFQPAPRRSDEFLTQPHLRFLQRYAADPDDGEECELRTPYQRDYWIENLTTAPVKLYKMHSAEPPVVLVMKNGTRAAGQSWVAWLTPAEAEAWTTRQEQPDLTNADRWKPFVDSIEVPAPARPGLIGVLRLGWEGKEPGEATVFATLSTSQGTLVRPASIQHSVVFVPAGTKRQQPLPLRGQGTQ